MIDYIAELMGLGVSLDEIDKFRDPITNSFPPGILEKLFEAAKRIKERGEDPAQDNTADDSIVDLVIPAYSEQDFTTSDAPYLLILSERDPIKREQIKAIIRKQAASYKLVKLFDSLLKLHQTNHEEAQTEIVPFMAQQPDCIDNAGWNCDSRGVYRYTEKGLETACPHPIGISKSLRNVDRGIYKVEISFYRRGRYFSVIVDRKTIASKQSIVSLADYGVNVNSSTAGALAEYLSDFETANEDAIAVYDSVSRLGWKEDGSFFPYDSNLIYDGEDAFRAKYMAVAEARGSAENWIKAASELMAGTGTGARIARILIDASLASALIRKFNLLPFIVHLYGKTGTGKTVLFRVAASVWGDPGDGKLVQSFDATAVGLEKTCSFLSDIPLILDESQIRKTGYKSNDFDSIIYSLTEGISRVRGSKDRGLQNVYNWKNVIITNGEQPLLSERSNSGAVNRVIQLDCGEANMFDSFDFVNDFYENYGHLGRMFIEKIKDTKSFDFADKYQRAVLEQLRSKSDGASGKAALSLSLILTVDYLLCVWFFTGTSPLHAADVLELLPNNNELDQNARAYSMLMDWIAVNERNFIASENNYSEQYGKSETIDEKAPNGATIPVEVVYIYKTVLSKFLEENGFNAKTFIDWAKAHQKIKLFSETDNGKTTVRTDKKMRTRGIGTGSRAVAFYMN